MIADKLFESYLSFKLKVLVAAQSSSSGATGLRAASPSTVTNSTTGCRKTSCFPPLLGLPLYKRQAQIRLLWDSRSRLPSRLSMTLATKVTEFRASYQRGQYLRCRLHCRLLTEAVG
jgi:hypothetical protein